ncbi:MATE family efflux transporter [Anaeromicropila populeti]|uniref:Probable multidrug resistance protein NorM n=1 Tax=Anaeromicropila populeti TaxID=37658 RepID=A0A1I6KQH8_9FIRM|nr:MATE family efflux transporter [Anaeromicropila populeti]SFR93454.1 putative efflux protein, MATE family [Anaeromicropila populeti]
MEQMKENKMGVMPIPKLLITISLPMIVSMLGIALYNIVDSLFVSKIDQDAFTALSLVFPVQNMMLAVGAGTGVGINALLSRSLGEKKYEEANRAAVNGLFLAICSWIVFALFGLLFSRTYFELQNVEDKIIQYGTSYMRICCIASIGLFLQMTLERLLQSTGRSFFSMITQLTGAIINIILDPVLIFGIGPFPKMGVAGAATATVIGQISAMLLAAYFNFFFNKDIQIDFKKYKISGRVVGRIYRVGIPSIIMQSIGTIMIIGMNRILIDFSKLAVNVFGAYFKLQSFIFMPVFGLVNGMIPIIAYNYGARKRKRIIDTIKLGLLIAEGIMLAGVIIFQLVPGQLLHWFDDTGQLGEIGVLAFRIISTSFLFAGFCITLSSVFQAFGDGLYSMIVSIGRQLIVLLPTAYLLAKLFGLNAVWYSYPIAEIASVTLSTMFFIHLYKKKIKGLENKTT